jgi:hypothetical protein
MRTACLVLLLLVAVAPPEVLHFQDSTVARAIGSTPPTSGWVIDIQRSVGNGATVVDLIGHGGEAVLLVAHAGSGAVGSVTWSGQSTSHALLGVDDDANVHLIAHVDLGTQTSLSSMDDGVLLVSNVSGDVDLMLVNVSTGTTTASRTLGGTSGPFALLAADGAGDLAVVSLTCTDLSTATQDLNGDDCSTSTGRQRIVSYAWTPSTDSISMVGDAGWFDGSQTDLQAGTQTGSLLEAMGPHPACQQHLDVHADGGVDALFQSGCPDQTFWSNAADVETTIGLFGGVSDWSPDALNFWGVGLGQSHLTPDGTESNDGWMTGFDDCSYAVDMDAEVGLFSDTLAYIVRGQSSSNSFCDYAMHTAADAGSPDVILRTKWKDIDRMVLGDRWLNTTELLSATGSLVSITGADHGSGSLVAVCHTGSLVQPVSQGSSILIANGGTSAGTTMLVWTGSSVYNVTTFPSSGGCVEKVASLGGRLVLLQDDGFLQTISLVTSDSDGDGYGDISDAFPSDGQQWADSDGDGWGDNAAGTNGDDCPQVWGNSTEGQRGCRDLDGDGWPDTLDAYPNEITQHRDSDGDGYGDNASGFQGDACPTAFGTSDEDRFGCLDSDRDGWSDANDDFPTDDDQYRDTDGDGYGDNAAAPNGDDCEDVFGNSTQGLRGCPDSDGDEWADSRDPFPNEGTQWADLDGDGYGDNQNGVDPDAFPFDPTQQVDGDDDGFGDNPGGTRGDACPNEYGTSSRDVYGCPDADGDGWSDDGDGFPNDPDRHLDSDRDGVEDGDDVFRFDPTQWADTDGDGYGDQPNGNRGDECPQTWGNSTLDRYGCLDRDGDGWSDLGDGFPDDPDRHLDTDGDSVEDAYDDFPFDPTQWNDTDGDGYGDQLSGNRGDGCPEEWGDSNVDQYGCPDSDGDGWSDLGDGFDDDPTRWSDTDKDGYEDKFDDFPFDPSQWVDSDGDGYGDNPFGSLADRFPDRSDQWSDIDGDGWGDNPNGEKYDAFLAEPTQWSDVDGDGCGDNPYGRLPDAFPLDPTQCRDEDGDGLGDNLSGNNPDPFLFDRDNDGYNDSIDVLPLFASPGDLDNDGVPDEEDDFPSNAQETTDTDGDGVGDNADIDDDDDGVLDTAELEAGTDPLDPLSKPIDSFEIVIPGTSVGLGAWDLIGVFLGIPLSMWVMFGIVTRGGRASRFESDLRGATAREDLEEIALRYERAVMMRLLGPHQAIRLERMRTELDDALEAAMLEGSGARADGRPLDLIEPVHEKRVVDLP